MKKPSHTEVQSFVEKLILPFYLIQRDMLVPDKERKKWRQENDAEHSWSVALLACALASHIDAGLDIGLVAQMGLVHDIVELYAGDVSVWAAKTKLANKQKNERQALQQLVKDFAHFPLLTTTLEAYERQDSNEARYVRAIDKYIALCIRFNDKGKFFRESGITKEQFEAGLEAHRKKAHGHIGVTEYYEKIRAEYDAHPEYFYQEK